MLTAVDLKNIFSALRPVIDAAVEAHPGVKNLRRAPVRPKPKKPSQAKPQPLKFAKDRTAMTATAQATDAQFAADAAMTATLERRQKGENVSFKTVHDEILGELSRDQQGTRARYAKAVARSGVRDRVRYSKPQLHDHAIPTPRGNTNHPLPPTYATLRDRAAAIARGRLGDGAANRALLSLETRLVLTELFEAAARKLTDGGVRALYAEDPASSQIIETYAEIRRQASDRAFRRCRSGQSRSFSDVFQEALDEIRERHLNSLNTNA